MHVVYKRRRFVTGDRCTLPIGGDAYTWPIWLDADAWSIWRNADPWSIGCDANSWFIWRDAYTLRVTAVEGTIANVPSFLQVRKFARRGSEESTMMP